MSAIQELAPYISEYQPRIKRAKMAKGYTSNDLVELSGITKSAVDRLCDGTQTDLKLFNAVALCKVLDLSLDELFGLQSSASCSPEIMERIHQLEAQNHEYELRLSEMAGELNVSKSEIAHQKEKVDMLQSQSKTRQPVIYTLMCLCAAMAFTLLVYIILDVNAPAVGFIQHGRISVVAWIVIAMIVSSVVAIAWSIIKVIRKK